MSDENLYSLDSLQMVLDRLNRSLDDFASQPARTASDQGAFGDFPLHKIAIWGDVDAAEVLLAHGANIDALGEDHDTALHRAVAGRNPNMIRFLLSKKADYKLRNRYGNSAEDDARLSGNNSLINAFGGNTGTEMV